MPAKPRPWTHARTIEQRNRRLARKQQGRCPMCNRPPITGKICCEVCIKQTTVRNRVYRAIRKTAQPPKQPGNCMYCQGTGDTVFGFNDCNNCKGTGSTTAK